MATCCVPRRLSASRRQRLPIALAILLLILVAVSQAQASTLEQQLAGLPTVQPFNGEATSTSMFAANWTAFAWGSEKGQDTTTGWRVVPAFPTEAAAYYATEYSAASGGVAAAVTMPVNPGSFNTGRFFSLWIDTASEAFNARSGYELRFTVDGINLDTYSVTLSKWQAGSATLLASQSGVSFINGNSLALADQGGTVTAWTNRGAGYTQLLTASDTTFNQGRVGIGGAGNITRLATYKAGQLSPPAPSLTGTSPASPADNNAPFVIGTAATGTTVKLYANGTCTGTPVTTGTAAALASPGLQARVTDNTTTRFAATATDGLNNVSDCSSAITYTERTDPNGIGAGLARLSQLDAFATEENPLSGGGRWTQLAWASHPGRVAGSGTSGGWAPYNAFPTVHGAYWNPASFTDAGDGIAVAATLSASPSATERWFSLWLDGPEPGRAQSGYELRFTNVDNVNRYDVTLTKWVAGARTVLARASGYTLAPQSSFALVDKGGVVSAWTDSGGGYGQLLTANDATYSRGYVAIEGAGNITRVRQFRAGALPSETGGMLAALPVVAAFDTAENPLSGGGAWTQLTWASHPGQVSGTGTTGGWGPYYAFPTIHGAYWNQSSFEDGGNGAAVAATLATSPSAIERYFSLWLDMPEPGRAQSGYELRFTNVDNVNRYNVTLSKWVSGARTVLATASGYTLAPQSSFALVDRGGTVSAWIDAGTGYGQVLTASDTTFSRGFAGLESAGNITRVRAFKAGANVTHIGEATTTYDPQTGTYTYTPQPGVAPMVGQRDAFELLDGAEQPLPDTEDPVTCATSGHRIKVVYSSGTNAAPPAELENEIRSIVRRTNSKLIRESLRSSGNTRALTLKVDCDAAGSIRIYSVKSVSNVDTQVIAAVENEVTGLGAPRGAAAVKYMIFRDARRYEELDGVNYGPEDALKSASDATDGSANGNRILTTSALIYRGPPGEDTWATHTPMHELTHAMGAVPPGAPHYAAGAHCTDGLDIMCYEQGDGRYKTNVCPTGTERGYNTPLGVPLDCNYDDYFDAATEPGEWLETHWNIGGSENPYVAERPADIPPGGYPTEAFITLDGTRNGAPGAASVHGHILRTNGAPAVGTVNVNFQKLVNGTWETMSTAQRTLDANGYYEVVNWSVGVGRWRVRTVFDKQGYYAESQSSYREFDITRIPTEAFITLDGFQNGAPGTASVHGHVLHAGNPVSGTVNVNFQKLVNGTWTTMSTAVRTLDANGYYSVVNWGVGVGEWRVRAVYPDQGDYAQSESEYKTFNIQPVPTTAYITLDGYQNGAPGTASLHGTVLRTSNGSPASGSVNVNFQKWDGANWNTMSTAQRTLDGSGQWSVSNWGVGVGSWRVRAVYNQQGDYAYSESEYRYFDIQPVATSAYITVDQVINGSPGRVSVSGNILWAGGGACCSVNVNFQKWDGANWNTMSTATPGLSNGHYVVSNWGVGVGSWRVRAVFNQQGDFGYSESPYHSFTISR